MSFDNVNVNVSGPVQPTSTYKTVVLKGNLPFASQVTEPNMKYVVKHDFDLGGASVTIPANCILQFDGGSLSNGTITGQNTGIQAGLVKIFNTDVILDGTWNVSEVYPEWFGAISNLNIDSTTAIQHTVDSAHSMKVKRVVLSGEKYKITDTINLYPYNTFCGITEQSLYPQTGQIVQFAAKPILRLTGNGTCIKKLKLIFDNSVTLDENCIGIEILNINSEDTSRLKLKFENLHIEKCYYGIYANNASASNIGYFCFRDSIIQYCTYGIYANLPHTNSWMNAAVFYHVHFTANTIGAAYLNIPSVHPLIVDSCCIEGNGNLNTETYEGYGIYTTHAYLVVKNSYFEANHSGKLSGNFDEQNANQMMSANIITRAESSIVFSSNLVNYKYNNIIHNGYGGEVYVSDNKYFVKSENQAIVSLINDTNNAPTLKISIDGYIIQKVRPIFLSGLNNGNTNYQNSYFCVNLRQGGGDVYNYEILKHHSYIPAVYYINSDSINVKVLSDKNYCVKNFAQYLFYNADLNDNHELEFVTNISYTPESTATYIKNKQIVINGKNKTFTISGTLLGLVNVCNSTIVFKNLKFVFSENTANQTFMACSLGTNLIFINCTFEADNSNRVLFRDLNKLYFIDCNILDNKKVYKYGTTVADHQVSGGNFELIPA